MTSTQVVLLSLLLGIVLGIAISAAFYISRSATKRREAMMQPELPAAALELLHPLDQFAVILDASLTPVYANPAARDDERITGEQLYDPELLRRARGVMRSGITDTQEPDPENPNDTLRIQIVRLAKRFVVVLVSDLGEEQRVNAMRRDFIANVSHELKTPIAAISLLTEAVLEGADDPEIVREFANKLTKQAKRLGDLSRDIIQLSEAQTSMQAEHRERFSINDTVRAEVEAHQEFASQHGVELVTTGFNEQQAYTLGRPAAIATVIANLLTNAVNHSPRGSMVGVGMNIQSEVCTVTVTDQGAGIAPEHLHRIFERFYRVDKARGREGGSTGLGLSIARHTMRNHGGDIEVWSQPGVGSSFTLTFPTLKPESTVASQSARKSEKPHNTSSQKTEKTQ